MLPHVCFSALTLLAAAAEPAGPAVAVLAFEARGGASAATAQVLSDGVVQAVRDSGAFARVISQGDLQALLGVEALKQMGQCDSNTCVAEIVGALNTP